MEGLLHHCSSHSRLFTARKLRGGSVRQKCFLRSSTCAGEARESEMSSGYVASTFLLSGLVASMPRNGFILLNEFHGRGNVLVPLPPKHVGVLSFQIRMYIR